MPYKHIAAQLKKTELACRLHYHQLSFGNKSRRTMPAASLDNFHRSSMTSPDVLRQPTPQRPLPSFSPPVSPPNHGYSPPNAAESPNVHKNILPRPIISSHRSSQNMTPLRLVTDEMKDRQHVDIARLDQLYEAHRLHFWSTIARHYGGNLSPATLEDAWRRAHGMLGSTFPPTPRGSPQSSQAQLSILTTPYSALTDPGKGSTSVTLRSEPLAPKSTYPSVPPKTSSFAISSLLTENIEVRSPSREKKAQEVEMETTSGPASAPPIVASPAIS